MTNFCPLFVLLMCFCASTHAQTLNPVSIHSSGGEYATSELALSISIGQLAVSAISGNGFTLTQGYQQGDGIIISVAEHGATPVPSVFPNPFMETLTLSPSGSGPIISARLYNSQAQLVWNNEMVITQPETFVMPAMEAGVYILDLTTHPHTSNRIRIAKLN